MTPFPTTVYESSSLKVLDKLSYFTWHLLSMFVRTFISERWVHFGYLLAVVEAGNSIALDR